jgi:hypothetical protein
MNPTDRTSKNNGYVDIKLVLVFAAFVSIFLPTTRFLVKFFYQNEELADAVTFFSLIAILASFFFLGRSIEKASALLSRGKNAIVFGLLAMWVFGVYMLSAASVNPPPAGIGMYWEGFGVKTAMLAGFLSPIVVAILAQERGLVLATLKVFSASIVIPVYFISIFQPPWAVTDWGHSMYVINEILSVSSGLRPLDNFTAQYTNLFGYIFSFFSTASRPVESAIWFLTTLAVLTIFLAVFSLTRLVESSNWKYFLVLITVPGMLIVGPSEQSYSGSIAALFSALPVRLFFPAVAALVLSSRVLRNNLLTFVSSCGCVCALGLINNFESGVVLFFSVCFVAYAVGRRCNDQFRRVLAFIVLTGFFLAGWGSLISWYFGGGLDLGNLYSFVAAFSSGFGAVPMPPFGLWVLVFCGLAVPVVTGWLYLQSDYKASSQSNVDSAAVMCLFWGLFGVGMLPYYIGRSINSGQLQFFLVPFFLSSAALILFLRAWLSAAVRRLASYLIVCVFAFPGSLSIASLFSAPSVNVNVTRLARTDNETVRELYSLRREMIDAADHIVAGNSSRTSGAPLRVAFLGDFGSLLTASTSVESLMPVNASADLRIIGADKFMNSLRKIGAEGATVVFIKSNDLFAADALNAVGFTAHTRTERLVEFRLVADGAS